MNFPFTEQQVDSQLFIREFSADVDEMELIWHTDREDRVVHIIEGNNWKFQLDNNIPFNLQKGKTYVIETKIWHRLIKGDDNLIIKIEEI